MVKEAGRPRFDGKRERSGEKPADNVLFTTEAPCETRELDGSSARSRRLSRGEAALEAGRELPSASETSPKRLTAWRKRCTEEGERR
jgi:hypothetical protein